MRQNIKNVNTAKHDFDKAIDKLLGGYNLWWESLEEDDQEELCALYFRTLTPLEQSRLFSQTFNGKTLCAMAADVVTTTGPIEKQRLKDVYCGFLKETLIDYVKDDVQMLFNAALEKRHEIIDSSHYEDFDDHQYDSYEHFMCDAMERTRDIKQALGQA